MALWAPVSNETMRDCGVSVLAGGRSRRMGADKAGLRLGGRTLLGHVRQAARGLSLPLREITKDSVPGCGPLGGILTALESSSHTAELFLACDMPFVSVDLLKLVLRVWQEERRPVFVVQGA